jgi:conjugative relaxase-like TrwC/TraI family protein
MVMSLAKMCAGAGVDYMLRHIARGDGSGREVGDGSLAAYYTASGYPPGVWLGSGLAGLADGRGVTPGSVVDENAMRSLFGEGKDPVTGARLGRAPSSSSRPVVGFDLTFSVPKSVSVLWGIAGPEIRAVIEGAHHDAITAALRLVERDVARTRIGAGGSVQVPVRGIIAAGFDHSDSRDGDPQLHTHVTVANRVQAADGIWRTLYGARLYRSAVAVSETYDALLADGITRALGLDWQWRDRGVSRNPARELAVVPQLLVDEFSTRSRAIDGAKDRSIAAFVTKHGRQPTDVEVIRIRQQVTLSTRQAKHVVSLAAHTAAWQARAGALLGTPTDAWAVQQIRSAPAAPRLATAHQVSAAQVEVIAAAVLDVVEAKHSTWTEWNIQAETARQIATTGAHFATAEDLMAVRDRISRAALDRSVLLNPDTAATVTQLGVRGAESSTHRVFTSLAILAAEERLLAAADERSAPSAPPLDEPVAPDARAATGRAPSRRGQPPMPDVSQREAVAAIATSGRVADVLVGPAGAGKSTAMRLLRDTWEATFRPGSVIGLAPSAAAARVLAGETGATAETCAQWVAQQHGEARRLEHLVALQQRRQRRAEAGYATGDLDDAINVARVEFDRWRLKPGQLVIIDEAGMADTRTLDVIVTQARNSGAKVLLVGDPAQLGAVGVGGAFAMLVAAHTDAPELAQVRRFVHTDGTPNRAEAEASKLLRSGNLRALAYYRSHGRIHTPPPGADPIVAAYAAWRTDKEQGLDALLIAVDNATVTALNHKAHDDLVEAGAVQPDGVRLADGTTAGIGDLIVTRRVDRHLADGTRPDVHRGGAGVLPAGYVTNGEAFTVTGTTDAGDLVVQAGRGELATLPAAYVARHVQLGYAITAHRAQGATVDTAHVIASPGMTREAFYVAMTRGRFFNHAHIDTRQPDRDIDRIGRVSNDSMGAATVLEHILATSGNPVAAHTIRNALRKEAAARQRSQDGAAAYPSAEIWGRRAAVERRAVPSLMQPGSARGPFRQATTMTTLRPIHAQRYATARAVDAGGRRPAPPDISR